jgi:hypothetical protein
MAYTTGFLSDVTAFDQLVTTRSKFRAVAYAPPPAQKFSIRAIRFAITATVVVAGSAGATWAILNLLENKPGIRIEIAPPAAVENSQASQDITTAPSSSRSAEIQPPAGPYHWILAEAPSEPVAAPAPVPQPIVATSAATPAATATPRAAPLPPVTVASRGEATPHAADGSAATVASLAPLPPERPVVAAAAPATTGPETVPLPPVIERPAVTPPSPAVADAGSVPLPPRRPAGLAVIAQPTPPTIAAPTPIAARATTREAQRVAALPDATATPAPLATPAPQTTSTQTGVTTVPVKPAQQDSRAVTPPPQDNRGFFQRLFGGMSQSAASTVASAGGRTAIYDIEAHTVYLPNGEKLEAHSGLGNRFDDPRYVSEKMRGATPPHLYDLELRRDLFHGVAALRMNPVGDGNMFGRNGILAHTYMLGPRGDSNGCVSFKDYARFLKAYQNGEITRIAVVPRLSDASYSVASSRH